MKKNYLKNDDADVQNEKTDRYLITYSDLITLLLGLFVILYSSSQVDSSKYKEMSSAFASVFGNKTKGDGILPGSKGGVILPKAQKTTSVNELEKEANNVLNEFFLSNQIFMQNSGSTLVISLPESLLFTSSKADINVNGNVILDSLSSLLANTDLLISVDGHTDSNPIRTFRYESNWHLSTDRALNVGYALIKRGLPEEHLVIRGFAAQRPIADNSTEEGRGKNRRVDITISEISSDVPTNNGYNK